MASYNFRKPAAGASCVRQNMHNFLCCLTIVCMLTLMKGACASSTTSVLHNKSGRDVVVIIPQQHLHIEVLAGQSIELKGSEQRRGVVIQDVQSGDFAGPFNLPDSPSLEVVQLDPSTYTATTSSLNADVAVTANINARVSASGNLNNQTPGGPR